MFHFLHLHEIEKATIVTRLTCDIVSSWSTDRTMETIVGMEARSMQSTVLQTYVSVLYYSPNRSRHHYNYWHLKSAPFTFISLAFFERGYVPSDATLNRFRRALIIFANQSQFKAWSTMLPSPYMGIYCQGISRWTSYNVWKKLYDRCAPHTIRTPKNVESRKTPFMSWKVLPVQPILSKNQWIFRKNVLSSQKRQRAA